MADEITLEVVTPERPILTRKVSAVVAPGVEGEFGVLPGHWPFMTLLGTGILSFVASDGVGAFVVSEGYAEVADNEVSILAEHADLASEIDLAKAREDIKLLEERLKSSPVMDEEFQRAQVALGRNAAKLLLAGRK